MFFGVRGDAFDPGILPKAFLRLQPYEIEDCLCIYKDNFGMERKLTSTRTCKGENQTKVRCCT
jgi:hypothetical protein